MLADGDLDALTFATAPPAGTPAGVARTNFSATAVNDQDQVQSLGIQSTGKIIAAGNTRSSGPDQIALVRYNTDGTLDMSFGGAAMGKVVVPNSVFGALVSRTSLLDMVVTPTDKIVLVGSATTDAGGPCVNGMSFSTDWAIAVFNADGMPDMGFDTDGFKAVSFFTCADNASSVAVQPADGKILVIGSAFDFGVLLDPLDDLTYTILARFNTDGSPDATFNGGPGGVAGESRFLPPTVIGTNDMVVLPVGDPNAGTIISVGGNGNFLMNRFTTTGALDATFGTGGAVSTPFPSGASSTANSVALYTDGTGRILLAGDVNSGSDFALARYNANGSLDDGTVNDTNMADAFRGDGKVVTDVSSAAMQSDSAKFVGILSDGKIVATGEAISPMVPMGSGSVLPSLGIAKYNTDGTLDGTFGTGGTKLEHFGDSGMGMPVHQNRAQTARGGALQSDGKILVGGQILAEFEDPTDFYVARFLNSVATAAGSLQFSAPTYSVGESGPVATITVTRTGGSDGTVMVNVATTNGTAVAPDDYADSDQVLTFLATETSKTFTIPIVNDTTDEPGETVNLALSNPTGGATLGAQSSAILTITDDDPVPAVSINDVTLAEGDGPGTTAFNFTVSLTNPSSQDITITYVTNDGTATLANNDYVDNDATVTFTAGQTTKTITVLVNGDTDVETDETFTVTLVMGSPAGAVVGGAKITGTGTITNDDSLAGSFQFSAPTYSVGESGPVATITVNRTGGDDGIVMVNVTTTDDTATAPDDYSDSDQVLTFGDGVTSQTFTIPIVNDPDDEPDETVNLALSNPTGGATLGSQSTAVLTITDDDVAPPPGLPECEVITLNSPGSPGTATIEDDADDPGNEVLIVTGTSGRDVIVVAPQPKSQGKINVTRNGRVIVTLISTDVPRIVVFGLEGNDSITVSAALGQSATILGGSGDDTIVGGSGHDQIDGDDGKDKVVGGKGNDLLCGGNGNDVVVGGLGNDFLGGDAGNDKVFGEAGSDFLLGNEGNDNLFGGSGSDRMYGQAGNDQVFGEAGNDIGVGGDGNDKLIGSSGRDVLIGGDGLDALFGDGHDDILVAGPTIYDEDDEALQAILAEWTSANSYTTRVNNIRNGGGANGAFVLDDTTVIDDSLKDTLWGDGGLDWFLFGSGDKLKDKATSELVN